MSDEQNRDAAWVSIEAPFSPQWLGDFVTDLERLFRINSLLEVTDWSDLGDGRIRLQGLNLSNGKPLDTELTVTRGADGVEIRYQGQLKTSTGIRIEAGSNSAGLLTITDDYSGTPKAERERRLDEVDRSLTQWGQDLHAYLKAWKRWSWLAPWRWYMVRVWQKMKPSARRITRWIVWISIAELVAFLFVFAIFVIER